MAQSTDLTLHVLKWLLALTFIALGASMYASILQRRTLAAWSACAVFVLSATIQWFAGMPHWVVYLAYTTGALQACAAVFMQIGRQRS
jgi:hypothetical protein